jgi:hypothetical protein
MAGLLGALFDPEFRKDVLRGLLDAGNRGAVAGLLGSPVDLATMALRAKKSAVNSFWVASRFAAARKAQ